MPASINLVTGLTTVVVALSGCGDSGGGEPPDPPPAEPIAYTVSGGFPPFVQKLRISAEGDATVSVAGPKSLSSGIEVLGPARSARFTVDPSRLTSISADLDSADIASLSDPEPKCTDCPLLELRYGEQEFETYSVSIPAELKTVLEQLDRLIRLNASHPGGGG